MVGRKMIFVVIGVTYHSWNHAGDDFVVTDKSYVPGGRIPRTSEGLSN